MSCRCRRLGDLPPPLTAAESIELRRRQRGKNVVLLVLLLGMAALFYAIAVVRFKVS